MLSWIYYHFIYSQPNHSEEQNIHSSREEEKKHPIQKNEKIEHLENDYFRRSDATRLNNASKNFIRVQKGWIEQPKETHFDRDNYSTRAEPSSPHNDIRKKKADKLLLKKGKSMSDTL